MMIAKRKGEQAEYSRAKCAMERREEECTVTSQHKAN